MKNSAGKEYWTITWYLYLVSLSNIDKKNCFLFHSTCIDIAVEFIPNTKACSSYSSFSRGSFVLFLLLLLLFFTFFSSCVSLSLPLSLHHSISFTRIRFVCLARHFHRRCIDLFCCFSLLYAVHSGCCWNYLVARSVCFKLSLAHSLSFDVCIRAVAVVTSSASPITFRLFIIRQSHLLHIVCYTVRYSYWLTILFFSLLRFCVCERVFFLFWTKNCILKQKKWNEITCIENKNHS